MAASVASFLLLSLACGVAGFEDASAMVQMNAAQTKPAMLDSVTGAAVKAPADEESEALDTPKVGGLAGFMKMIATGAQADGDSSMSNFFSKASSLANTLQSVGATPAPVVSSAEGFTDLAHNLENWGKKTQNYFSSLESAPEKQDKKILSSIKQRIVRAVPPEIQERAAQLKSTVSAAKSKLSGLLGFQANATAEEKAANMKKLGDYVQWKLKTSQGTESVDAKNLKRLANFMKDLKVDSSADKAASTNPMAGVNDWAAGLRRIMRGKADAPAQPAATATQPAAMAEPAVPAAPAAPQPMPQQVAAPMQAPQFMPMQPPQQWAPPAQAAWQPAPPMMPMGYPMGAPQAMPQYPAGGMPQYPQQMR
uniref:Uncharacterized protein n=1 Tax=Alexandrium catenella TaxID=2925 RepID=A0A7S1RZF2_ALECA